VIIPLKLVEQIWDHGADHDDQNFKIKE